MDPCRDWRSRFPSIVTVLAPVAVCLYACDLPGHAGNGNVEVVAATAARATRFPAGDMPSPRRGDRDLARGEWGCRSGAGEDGEGLNEEKHAADFNRN
jgi:hypothetical protein